MARMRPNTETLLPRRADRANRLDHPATAAIARTTPEAAAHTKATQAEAIPRTPVAAGNLTPAGVAEAVAVAEVVAAADGARLGRNRTQPREHLQQCG